MTTRPHIIVEGPDGSGKDGLITRFRSVFPGHQMHPRASTSTGGPIPYLTGWVLADMASIDASGPWMYNRHPIISEPIYAPTARRTDPQGKFSSPQWCMEVTQFMADRAVVVWCMPPKDVVMYNVLDRPDGVAHMPGVAEHIEALYDLYDIARKSWPGPSFTWNYGTDDITVLAFSMIQAMK